MAEEVKNAAINVPRAIAWGYVVNGFLALVFMVTYLFAMPSVNDALHDRTEFPFIYVFKQAVSTQGVNGLTSIVLVLVIASNISFNASASRQTFSFARDHGLPFSRWLSTVHPKRHIPANAILLSCMISVLLSLINIGSTVAFEAIVSLNVAALMSTYMVSISCVLYRRIYEPNLLPPARWSFGRRSGLFVNGIGLSYSIFVFFWSFWPVEKDVHADSFNWSVVIFSGVTVIASFMYLVQGRKMYSGPVTSVVGRSGGSSQRLD
jgi:amino acid transporter